MLCQHMGNAFHNVGNRVFMGDTPQPGNGTTAPRSAVLSENAHYSGDQSIAGAFQILRCVAKAGGERLRLREVTEQMQLNSSTADRLLMTLAAEGVVINDATETRYRVETGLLHTMDEERAANLKRQ